MRKFSLTSFLKLFYLFVKGEKVFLEVLLDKLYLLVQTINKQAPVYRMLPLSCLSSFYRSFA